MGTSNYKKEWMGKRKNAGVCLSCGGMLDRDGVTCTACRAKINKSVRERRQWYAEHRVCPRCGKVSLIGEERTCPECRARDTELVEKRRNKNRDAYNESQRILHKSIYNKRKQQGLCTRCGKRKSSEGYLMCGICREKDRERKRMKYGKPNRSERYKQGLCYFCDNPVKEGYKVCEKHYQMDVEKARGQKANNARKKLIEARILY